MSSREQFETNLNGIQNREPVLLGTAIVNLIAAFLALGAAWGLEMTAAQQDAMWQTLAAFSVVLWLVAPVIRSKVWSPASVAEITAGDVTRLPNP